MRAGVGLVALALFAGCGSDGDPCEGVRCAGSSVSVTVVSDAPLSMVSATSSVLSFDCEDVSASFETAAGTRWVCRGRPEGPGVVDVTVESDRGDETVTVDVTSRESECCGVRHEGTATVVLGGDAGA